MERPSSRLKVVDTTLRKSTSVANAKQSKFAWEAMSRTYIGTCSRLVKMSIHLSVDIQGKAIADLLLTDFRVHYRTIQGVDDSQSFLDRLGQLFHSEIQYRTGIVRLELKLVNDMAEIVMVLVLEIRHQVLNVHVVGLERASVREVEVSDDLVDENSTLNTTALGVLFGNLLAPSFFDALSLEKSATRG